MVGCSASMLAFVRRACVACLRDRLWLWRALFAVCVLAACGFPNYGFVGATGGSGGSAGAAGGAAGSGGQGGAGTGPGGHSGMGGASGGSSGSAGAAPTCVILGEDAGAPSVAPHCSDLKTDDDETGTDCGGPTCAPCFHTEACITKTDCASGSCTAAKTCAPLFDLEYLTVVAVRETNTLQFKLKLTYLATAPLVVNNLAIRYYFARGNVADPVVPYGTQALLRGLNFADQTQWKIVRVLPDPTALADTYLEITFAAGTTVLLQDDVIELTQSIQDGSSGGQLFDQNTHYSFQNVTNYTTENTATVYNLSELAWGIPPPYTVPRQCFYTAVNFAGQALTAGGVDFLAGTDKVVTFTGSTSMSTAALADDTDPDLVPLLQSSIQLDSASATLNVPNGKYYFYPYVVTGNPANTDVANLLVQGTKVATFAEETVGGFPAWAKLGPYLVSVTNGKLALSASGGMLLLAGAELYEAAE
jgi:hypothetical protein